ncbi:hypothetical protein, partial [Frankia sp. AvcI1]
MGGLGFAGSQRAAQPEGPVLTAGEMLGTLLHRGETAKGEPISARMVHLAFADAVEAVNAAAAERKRDRKAR